MVRCQALAASNSALLQLSSYSVLAATDVVLRAYTDCRLSLRAHGPFSVTATGQYCTTIARLMSNFPAHCNARERMLSLVASTTNYQRRAEGALAKLERLGPPGAERVLAAQMRTCCATMSGCGPIIACTCDNGATTARQVSPCVTARQRETPYGAVCDALYDALMNYYSTITTTDQRIMFLRARRSCSIMICCCSWALRCSRSCRCRSSCSLISRCFW